MRIGRPARRRGLTDDDILHAVRNALRKIDIDDDFTMMIGLARDTTLLEVGILSVDGDEPVIMHAMPLRASIYRCLDGR